MSETNGTVDRPRNDRGFTPTEKGLKARELIQRLGPDVTSKRYRDEAGADAVSEPCFYALRAKLFGPRRVTVRAPEPPTPVATTEPARATIPDRPPTDDRPSPVDYLGKLIRFGLAVEAAGGIESARRMLDALDQLKRA